MGRKLFGSRPKPRSGSRLKNPPATDHEPSSEPPPKRRKYIPGGPGGGGRYVEIDGTETPVRPMNSASQNKTASRSRPPRETPRTAPPKPPPPPPATPPASTRPRREKNQGRRFSSAAAAVLAVAQGDGYKPREERGWEEFHPDLDIDAKIAVFSSEEVDGVLQNDMLQDMSNGDGVMEAENSIVSTPTASTPGIKRRPGRPRRGDNMSNNMVPFQLPKLVPPPGPNPREKLTLPKPSFALKDPFLPFEQKGVGQQNYVDRTMASVGYQESDIFLRHERRLIRMTEDVVEEDLDLDPPTATDGDSGNAAVGNTGVGRVEYDMDEQDAKWLEAYNAQRRIDQFEPIKPAIFEITMTKIEKEWYALEKRIPKPNPKPPQTQRPRSSSAAAVNGEHAGTGEEQDSKCAVCDDGDCENSNAIVFCDGCDLAVHQECYGVPYIPEGQWLCRKCQLIGRGSPSCIFCPNTEGAFKQTNTSKWSHLLCAVWIPEVSIGNPSLMEPVLDVEKVPRSRWKLTCYICRQKMGACIQCSNKNCFAAFHVTCGRRARLYLKMKLTPGVPAIMDSNSLKAFCDRHVPPDWRREYNTDGAIADAMEYYRTTMQGRRWGDSQAAALALGPEPQGDGEVAEDDQRPVTPRITLTVGGNKRKRLGPPKMVWKLPSGAPVVPQVILNNVIVSLQRFTVRQRKQYAEDACKYWTLKREARRGAALLKRLQLQLETFSSMEMTRRNFAGMGPTGSVRLQRRIEFADRLSLDVDKVRMLCDEVKKREREKLKDAETLRNIVDLVYFPISPMIWPIFERVQALDGKGIFRVGLLSIRSNLENRSYTSVSAFSRDLAHVFTSEIGVESVGDTAELQLQMQISGRAPELSLEQREKRKLAKRIIKAVQPALEDALKKESELSGKPYERELRDLDLMLENSVLSRRGSFYDSIEGPATLAEPCMGASMPNGIGSNPEGQDNRSNDSVDVEMTDAVDLGQKGDEPLTISTEIGVLKQMNGEEKMTDAAMTDGSHQNNLDHPPVFTPPTVVSAVSSELDSTALNHPKAADSLTKPQDIEAQAGPPTPPASFKDSHQPPLAQGGIQWYMEPFDPVGTTIHEERWTGREVLRGMSEELSELDEDELRHLVDDEFDNGAPEQPNDAGGIKGADQPGRMEMPQPKGPRTRRRWRGFR
ncbi:PHD finger domain-containing protein [Coccidioides immitis RS]|uniref:PHD finger domain-containing protein n=2 Tax=Coccidioides immitis TaxID=5501 RepID=J3KE13_COCIM|nr:PHD finger domain-containing protein [Coccidioides immitis RS]EAS33674.3 PHD finger domain-containing protein [Coccidioides immitis RS]TPX21336.1 nuA3 HAT complex component nto1 [Coccidioides immitis]